MNRSKAMIQTLPARIVQFAEADPRIDVLWLYGSQAKGTATEYSDYDFAVAFNTFPVDEWEKRLQPELLARQWADQLNQNHHKISVVDINHIPLPLAYSVISTGQVLLAKNTLRQAIEENRISSMWELDYLYHKKTYG